MPHVAFHTFPVPEFSSPAFSMHSLQFGADNSSLAFSAPALTSPMKQYQKLNW